MEVTPSWYSVRVLSRSERQESDAWKPGIVEDRLILVSATSEEEAREKGLAAARREDSSFRVTNGSTVRWTSDEVLEICTLLEAEIVDGSEIYHAYLDESAAVQLREILAHRFSE